MSNQFYNYLSEKIIAYFMLRQPKSGERFNIQFENDGQVKSLYLSLSSLDNIDIEPFRYYNNKNKLVYETFCLLLGDIKIIVSATTDGVQPDFLTLLRNKVGTAGQFENTCILFIHDTTLDSLVKGAEGFHKEGMPFSINAIVNDIDNKILTSALSKTDKLIVKSVLERKRKDILEDPSSIFEYEYLLGALNNISIDKKNYTNFGFFYDPDLSTFSISDAKERLKVNYTLFTKVDSIHKYGNPEEDLEKLFDDKGIDTLKEKDWDNAEFKFVKQSFDNKKNISIIQYLEISNTSTEEGLVYWEKPESESKVKSRIRNIIIFNYDRLDRISLEFNFDNYTKNQYVKDEDNALTFSSASGKKIKTIIHHKVGTTGFCKVIYKDENVKYEFKLAIVECRDNVLADIKTCYSIYIKSKDRFIFVNTDEDKIVLNPRGVNELNSRIQSYDYTIELESNDQKLVLLKDIENIDDEREYIRINLKYQDSVIPLALREEVLKPEVITGLKVWKLKRESSVNFEYKGNNKLIQGTKEYFAKEEFRYNLEREKYIIDIQELFYIESSSRELEARDLEIDAELKRLYKELVRYYNVRGLLPSLTYLEEDLREISIDYINRFITVIGEIKDNLPLTNKQKNLIKVGTIERSIEEREIIFTPFHPLNVAYQIYLNDVVSKSEIPDNFLRRLNPSNLLPYIYNEFEKIYKPIEQSHSPEWNYYVNYKIPRYKGSRMFVSKLVKEKISEFVNHFSYLFDKSKNSPIIINLVNLGDCKEVLQGIFEYYINLLDNSAKTKDLLPINLYIYGDKNTHNVFEEISFYNEIQQVKDEFNIKLSCENYSEEDVLNTFRDKVHFYMKDYRNQNYQYCHMTFYQMDQHIKETYGKMDDINTGISLGGLMSGVPSVYIGDSYRTGFGTKYLDNDNNFLLTLAVKLNALARTARKLDPFNQEECIITAISEKDKKSLDQIYNSSHWVTFIEPKVDLSFFKNDDEAKDLLIIHYSDQYTSSSGYDAITVTRKSKQYQMIIEEFLSQKEALSKPNSTTQIINLFNAVNGDWLLRMLSYNNQFSREKLSILSAIKLSLSYFYHKDIVWIPVSLEEILRISGGTGLSKSEGLFSAKSLGVKGSYSDDLLLIGIEEIDEKLKVHYYPIEVKIGNVFPDVIDKAVKQAQETRKLLEEKLNGNEYLSVLHRNFLIQLAIVSAEKMKLYDVWPEQTWDRVINSDNRAKLLNDEYDLSCDLDKYIGKGSVISFKNGIFFRKAHMNENILMMDFTENDGYVNITKSVEDLKDYFASGKSDFNINHLLANTYHSSINPSESLAHVTEENFIHVPMKVLFGHSKNDNLPVVWYPTSTDKVMHTNTGIIGTMGTGKTQFTKSLITQLYRNSHNNVNGTKIGIIIFDYKGDYVKQDFVEATNAKVYKLYKLPYNPLALYMTDQPKPLLPLHTADNLKETISTAFNLGHVQKNLLRELILEAYKKRGIQIDDPTTWANLHPTIHDVYSIYKDRENVKEDSLYSALSDLSLFQIFESDTSKTKPLFDMIDGVTVIDLSGNNDTIQNLVVAVTLDIFYNQMQVTGHSSIQGNFREITRMILVDEADNFLSKDFKSIKKILKEGREFGVGTILSTQLLSHFSTNDNEYANYIMTWIVHNVADVSNKDIKYIFNTQSKSEEENILNKVKQLEKHHSIVKLGSENEPIWIRDKAFWELKPET